ncbi:hypothetical protein [Arenimonas terrae]|uniref:hypothetical protein n=1 Tax=Arenimonas terrae TaxID=2546226 RepID=UPI001C70AACE|nr:hypothetical protein [Arenimonas terrae]
MADDGLPAVSPGAPSAAAAARQAGWPQLAPWIAALAGLALVLAVFWPGYMSWDSAYQWWQARHDRFDSVHPPLLAMIWQLTDRVVEGPGGMFALQCALLWSALALFAAALPVRPIWRALIVLGFGLWPPLLALQPHVWKDLWTLAAFAWALALMAEELRTPHRGWRVSAVVALVFACAFRHNAITGALPLLLWLCGRELSVHRPLRHPRLAVVALASTLTLLVALVAALPARDGRVRHTESIWSVVTLWDAAAVSLAENRLVYPTELVDPTLTLDELRGKFTDYSNTTVFETHKLHHSFDGPYTPAQRKALRQLALDLPTQHTRAYAAHRWRLAQLLYGWDRAALPDGLVLMPGLHAYGDNPALAVERSALHERALAGLLALVDTPLFAGWIYLALCAGVIALAWRRSRVTDDADAGRTGLAAAVAASALMYALPLALVSGSAEFRYLAWPVLATLAALVLSVRSRGTPRG